MVKDSPPPVMPPIEGPEVNAFNHALYTHFDVTLSNAKAALLGFGDREAAVDEINRGIADLAIKWADVLEQGKKGQA